MTATSPESIPGAPARLFLLGAFRLEIAGQPVALPTRKAETLLAYLALHGEPADHNKKQLTTLFWGDSTDADARRSLRVALTGLRKALGGDPFTGDRDTIGLDPTYPLWTDALALEDLARRFLADTSDDLAAHCAALYRGDLLTDFYDDWLSLLRDRLRARYQQVLRALAERRRERGDYAAAAEAANRLLALDPADEAAHQQLMFCYLAQGNRPAALQQSEACAPALRDELAVPPPSETEALLSWIRDAAPARSPAARRGNVPLPLTDLIGRADALAEVERLLAPQGRTRLLTLTGPGGNGKTRLAEETGHAVADHYRDGAWWVDLVPLTDGAQIAAAVTRALGLPETPGQPAEESLIRDHTVGFAHADSNFGYLLLGRIIETVSGKNCDTFMRDNVLTPVNAQGAFLSSNFAGGAKEVQYFTPINTTGASRLGCTGFNQPGRQLCNWQHAELTPSSYATTTLTRWPRMAAGLRPPLIWRA